VGSRSVHRDPGAVPGQAIVTEKTLAVAARIVDAWLPLKIAYARVPAASVGITYRGKLVYANGFGLADIENETPATPTTAYRIASNSKTFTAVGIMQLVERGKLRLDDKVAAYLPWFKAKAKGRDAAHITIRDVLSHHAGVFRDGVTPHWEDDDFPTVTQLKRSVSSISVVHENAVRFKYSNFGFALLGQIIEKASGSSYDDYMRDNVIGPLRMTRTAPDLTDESRKWLATGYSRPIPGVERERFVHCKTNAYASATGFLSTVTDLAKYLNALSLARNTTTLVGREAKKQLFHEYWRGGEEGSYGLGFSIMHSHGHKVVGHGGGFPGFITRVALDVDSDVGVIVLTNANDSPAGFIAAGIFDMIGRLSDPRKDYLAGPRIAGAPRFEGAYRNRWGDVIVVSLGGKLVAFPPQTDAPLREGTVLRPAGTSSFVMDSPFGTASPGERARFNGDRLLWGSQPMTRIAPA
jgi:D-alanyl-D-alanine carboxypeptidase